MPASYMLNDQEIERLFVALSLPEDGRKLVRFARAHSPVRAATTRLGNSIHWLYSRKMGNRHLELESRTVEQPAAMLYENDPSCLEYWPQPFKLDLQLLGEEGTPTGRQPHTPDFLLIKSDGIYVHEWREESRLMRAAKKSQEFYKDDDGTWHYRAPEVHLSRLGLKYELHSGVELPTTYIQNAFFLRDYNEPGCPPANPDAEQNLLEILRDRGSVPYFDLLQRQMISADDIFKCIVKGTIAADLERDRLDDPANLVIHRDYAVARVYRILSQVQDSHVPIAGMGVLASGSTVVFNGRQHQVLLVGSGQVLLKDPGGQQFALPVTEVESLYARRAIDVVSGRLEPGAAGKTLASLSEPRLQEATRRMDILAGRIAAKISERTKQRWRARIAGLASDLDKLIALADDRHLRGNENPRLPDDTEKFALETINTFHNTPTCETPIATFRMYKKICSDQNVTPMSFPTFCKRLETCTSTVAREGKRKAYQEAPIPLYLDHRFPVNGCYPDEILYSDHTVLTIATKGPGGSDLGKPYLTLGTDGHTTRVRAFYLSYDPPRAASVMMLLRDYVRRYHRLPRVLVVDGGAEFRSRELQFLCRIFAIELRYRATGKPRGGSPVERTLGATEIELIAQLEGNTRIMRNARMVTKSVNPFPRAVWTLTALHGALDKYLFELRDNRIHPTLGMTPLEYHNMRVHEAGLREHKLIRFDENFMLMTCPHPKRWEHVIDLQRGVWVDNDYYWHDAFLSAHKGEKVEVKVEMWNARVVYANFRGKWVPAISRNLHVFAGRTNYEVELARRAERRYAKVQANRERLSLSYAKRMVELWDPLSFDPRISAQQREMAHLYEKLGMTAAMPAAAATPVRGSSSVMPSPTIEEEDQLRVHGRETNKTDSNTEAEVADSDNSSVWSNTDDFV